MVKIISIEANIGAGKTTFINKLFDTINNTQRKLILIPEPVDKWLEIKGKEGKSSLNMFYSNPKENALPFQLIALLTRRQIVITELKKAAELEREGYEVILISERTIYSDYHIFASLQYSCGNI